MDDDDDEGYWPPSGGFRYDRMRDPPRAIVVIEKSDDGWVVETEEKHG